MKAGTRVKIVSIHKKDAFYLDRELIGAKGELTNDTSMIPHTHWFNFPSIWLDARHLDGSSRIIQFYKVKLEKI